MLLLHLRFLVLQLLHHLRKLHRLLRRQQCHVLRYVFSYLRSGQVGHVPEIRSCGVFFLFLKTNADFFQSCHGFCSCKKKHAESKSFKIFPRKINRYMNTWNLFVRYFGASTLQKKAQTPIKTGVIWVLGICIYVIFLGNGTKT